MQPLRRAWLFLTFPFHPLEWNNETHSWGKPNSPWWNVLVIALFAAIVIYLGILLLAPTPSDEVCHYAGGGNLDTDIVCEEVDPSLLPP